LAVTYGGRQSSFSRDGVLKGRVPMTKDFLLGTRSRGLWVGCYVGMDFWYSGKMDEVRVSGRNCSVEATYIFDPAYVWQVTRVLPAATPGGNIAGACIHRLHWSG